MRGKPCCNVHAAKIAFTAVCFPDHTTLPSPNTHNRQRLPVRRLEHPQKRLQTPELPLESPPLSRRHQQPSNLPHAHLPCRRNVRRSPPSPANRIWLGLNPHLRLQDQRPSRRSSPRRRTSKHDASTIDAETPREPQHNRRARRRRA